MLIRITIFLLMTGPAILNAATGEYIFPASLEKGFLMLEFETGKPNEKLRLIVDTGAEATSVEQTHPAIKRLSGGTNVRDGQGRAWGKKVYLPQLKVGKKIWTRPRVIASSFTHLRKGTGVKLDGVLGVDLLVRHVVILDYEKRQVRLQPSFGFKPGSEDKLIPCTFKGLLPVVDIKLGKSGQLAGKALFDTGAGGVGLLAYPKLAKKLESKKVGAQRGGVKMLGALKYAWGMPEFLTFG